MIQMMYLWNLTYILQWRKIKNIIHPHKILFMSLPCFLIALGTGKIMIIYRRTGKVVLLKSQYTLYSFVFAQILLQKDNSLDPYLKLINIKNATMNTFY